MARAEQGRSRTRAGKKQCGSKAGAGKKQGKSRAGHAGGSEVAFCRTVYIGWRERFGRSERR